MGIWNTARFNQVDAVFMLIYVLFIMLFYFYFFWPFQISLVIDSMQQVVCSDGYPAEMESLTLREIIGTGWLLNIKPWAALYDESDAKRD